MVGLSQSELMDILNRVNSTNQIRKTDLHQAIAAAITANNQKLIQDIQERTRQNIEEHVRQRTTQLIDAHIRAYH